MNITLAGVVVLASTLLQSGALTFTAPSAWRPRLAASTMRVAEFVVPRAPGDTEDADVIVYYFGGTGGSVDANITRWIGQFQQPAGKPADPGRTTYAVGSSKVTTVDVSGTYIAEVRPGAAERHNKPNFRMRAAVVETRKGPYFVKLTGPSATVKQHASAFDQFLKTMRFDGRDEVGVSQALSNSSARDASLWRTTERTEIHGEPDQKTLCGAQ